MNSVSLTKKAKDGLKNFLNTIKELRSIIEAGDIFFKKEEPKGEGLAPFIYEVLKQSGFAEYYESVDSTYGKFLFFCRPLFRMQYGFFRIFCI